VQYDVSMMKKTLAAGVAALLITASAVHADTQLPDAMLGYWCYVDRGTPFQQSFRHFKAGESCSPPDTLVVNSDSVEEEVGTCKFKSIEQSAPSAYLVHLDRCIPSNSEPNGSEALRIFELVGEELMITWMPEG
jgi:hypothetical protein